MIVEELLGLDDADLKLYVLSLSDPERAALQLAISDYLDPNPYIKYNGDVKRIITEEWGEGLWSKQHEILDSFNSNRRTVVVTTPGVGKSDVTSLICCALIAAYLHDPGKIRIITTAANFRLVKTILWPYMKRVAAQFQIPGYDSKFKPSRIGTTEWHVNNVLVADGVAAADNDETAMRGIHSLGRVVIVVDEAGGISKKIGRVLNGLMTSANDRMLVLGNPPTDETDTWFEWLAGQPEDIAHVIKIPYTETPNFSGEVTPVCKRCGPREAPHTISKHLTSQVSINDVRRQYPDDNDPYVRAFLYAEFPTGNTAKAIPAAFIAKALPVMHKVVDSNGVNVLDPSGRILEAPDDEWLAKSQRTGPIKLGIDVASDGGDEFVIAWRDNWHGKIVHHSSGPMNEDAVQVSGVCLEWVQKAADLHKSRDIPEPVVVNVDRLGVGWGVESFLRNWCAEQKLNVEVVGVQVGERAIQATRFSKVRSEVWWNMRELLAADDCEVTFDDDPGLAELSLAKQLNGPTYRTGTDGRTSIESKPDMKKRGTKSPDRADAMLLAYYDSKSKHRSALKAVSWFPQMKQENVHAAPGYNG